MAAKLRITWKKSAIGYRENQKRTIEALGLKRLGHTVEQPANRAVGGKMTPDRHLVHGHEATHD